MHKYLLYIVLFACCTLQLQGQEDGVVALELPVRNALKFNRFAINPTFSFVREQNKYVSFSNKRQWVQFNDAPQTYLFSYSGRFRENVGAGVALFQQDYGVLTTFGGVLNFAYNAVLSRESNLTFGMNLGFYKSGLNQGSVVTNFPDPSLDNFPSNSVLTINPGINYGTTFFDFGVSINNAVAYNFTSSKMIEDNPEQGIQAHLMYTGYMNSRGFFYESKFSTLVRSEFKKEETIVSGIAMITVPKGIWAQAGYNTKYGMSAGLGFNVTKQIAIEYNYEKALGDFSNFGNSHEFTLAYKFNRDTRFRYSDDDDEQALFTPSRRSKRVLAKNRPPKKPRVVKETTPAVVNNEEETKAQLAEETNQKALEEAKQKEEERLKAEQEALVLQEAEQARLKTEAEEQARLKAIELKKQQAAAKRKEEERLKAKQEAENRRKEEERIRAEQEALALEQEQERLKAEAAEQARLEAIKLKEQQEAEAQAKLAQEAKEKAEEEERIRLENLEEVVIPVAKDDATLSMNNITKLTDEAKLEQEELLIKLREKVASKQQDLDDLKEENDLSEQGIYKQPKPFKSISEENNAIKAIQLDIDNAIKSQDLKIKELEAIYNERLKKVRDKEDEANKFYSKKIQELKTEQLQIIQARADLNTSLEAIKVATEIERKRRIKRAAYDNEQERYKKDRARLTQIKQFTPLSTTPLKPEDFDSGEVLSNIQILKDVSNTEPGYYAVIAIHSDIEKRDEFLRKAVASGQSNINFFFDVNTSKYYIYYEKFDYIEAINKAQESKGSQPYNENISIIKIED